MLISGLTVMIAMAGMFFAGSIVFKSFAIGTILVVGIAVLGSLTVLPAVLSKLGDKVEKGRVPIIGRMRHLQPWRVARVGLDPRPRPAPPGRLARGRPGAILVALSIPALGMHTANPGTSGLPRDLEVMKVYDRIQAAFPGGPIPAIVAVQADDVTKPEVQAGIDAMSERALASGQMSEPVTTNTSPDKTVEVVSIPITATAPTTRRTPRWRRSATTSSPRRSARSEASRPT